MNQVFEECGCCGHYHLSTFSGDCRDDANRFTTDQLPEGAEVVDLDDPQAMCQPVRVVYRQSKSDPSYYFAVLVDVPQYIGPEALDKRQCMIVAIGSEPTLEKSQCYFGVMGSDYPYLKDFVKGTRPVAKDSPEGLLLQSYLVSVNLDPVVLKNIGKPDEDFDSGVEDEIVRRLEEKYCEK